jgi:hypothetical protein
MFKVKYMDYINKDTATKEYEQSVFALMESFEKLQACYYVLYKNVKVVNDLVQNIEIVRPEYIAIQKSHQSTFDKLEFDFDKFYRICTDMIQTLEDEINMIVKSLKNKNSLFTKYAIRSNSKNKLLPIQIFDIITRDPEYKQQIGSLLACQATFGKFVDTRSATIKQIQYSLNSILALQRTLCDSDASTFGKRPISGLNINFGDDLTITSDSIISRICEQIDNFSSLISEADTLDNSASKQIKSVLAKQSEYRVNNRIDPAFYKMFKNNSWKDLLEQYARTDRALSTEINAKTIELNMIDSSTPKQHLLTYTDPRVVALMAEKASIIDILGVADTNRVHMISEIERCMLQSGDDMKACVGTLSASDMSGGASKKSRSKRTKSKTSKKSKRSSSSSDDDNTVRVYDSLSERQAKLDSYIKYVYDHERVAGEYSELIMQLRAERESIGRELAGRHLQSHINTRSDDNLKQSMLRKLSLSSQSANDTAITHIDNAHMNLLKNDPVARKRYALSKQSILNNKSKTRIAEANDIDALIVNASRPITNDNIASQMIKQYSTLWDSRKQFDPKQMHSTDLFVPTRTGSVISGDDYARHYNDTMFKPVDNPAVKTTTFDNMLTGSFTGTLGAVDMTGGSYNDFPEQQLSKLIGNRVTDSKFDLAVRVLKKFLDNKRRTAIEALPPFNRTEINIIKIDTEIGQFYQSTILKLLQVPSFSAIGTLHDAFNARVNHANYMHVVQQFEYIKDTKFIINASVDYIRRQMNDVRKYYTDSENLFTKMGIRYANAGNTDLVNVITASMLSLGMDSNKNKRFDTNANDTIYEADPIIVFRGKDYVEQWKTHPQCRSYNNVNSYPSELTLIIDKYNASVADIEKCVVSTSGITTAEFEMYKGMIADAYDTISKYVNLLYKNTHSFCYTISPDVNTRKKEHTTLRDDDDKDPNEKGLLYNLGRSIHLINTAHMIIINMSVTSALNAKYESNGSFTLDDVSTILMSLDRTGHGLINYNKVFIDNCIKEQASSINGIDIRTRIGAADHNAIDEKFRHMKDKVANDKTVTKITQIDRLINDEYERKVDNTNGKYEVETNAKMLNIRALQNQKTTLIDYLVGQCAMYDSLIADQIKHTQQDIDTHKHQLELLVGHRVVAIAGMVATKEKIDYTIAKVMAYATFFNRINWNNDNADKFMSISNRIVKIVYNMLVTVEHNYAICCGHQQSTGSHSAQGDGTPPSGTTATTLKRIDPSPQTVALPTFDVSFRETHVKYIDCSGCSGEVLKVCDYVNSKLPDFYKNIELINLNTYLLTRINTLVTRYNYLYMRNVGAPTTEMHLIMERIKHLVKKADADDADNAKKDINSVKDYLVNKLLTNDTLKPQVVPIVELIETTIKQYNTHRAEYLELIHNYHNYVNLSHEEVVANATRNKSNIAERYTRHNVQVTSTATEEHSRTTKRKELVPISDEKLNDMSLDQLKDLIKSVAEEMMILMKSVNPKIKPIDGDKNDEYTLYNNVSYRLDYMSADELKELYKEYKEYAYPLNYNKYIEQLSKN